MDFSVDTSNLVIKSGPFTQDNWNGKNDLDSKGAFKAELHVTKGNDIILEVLQEKNFLYFFRTGWEKTKSSDLVEADLRQAIKKLLSEI